MSASDAAVAQHVAPVRVWEEDLVIPTYIPGPLSRISNFLQEGYGRIYPYTRNDDLQTKREDRIYRAVYIENEYLKVTVLPELGGHIHGVVDKTNGREVFYRNGVVKPGLVSLRGAWIPTGVEFNFPIGHTVVTLSPVDYCFVEEEGFGGVEVSDVELVSRMRWSVTIGLYPGKSLVATRIRLYNRTDLMNRYYFWANAAVHGSDGFEFICDAPAAWNWRGVVNFPVHRGKNIALYKSYEWGSDLFTFGGENDFFGGYHHDMDTGVVNLAPLQEVQGRKFFTWGRGKRGEVWARILTDDSGPYLEIQRGRFPTQADFAFIEPGEMVEWTEHWYPVRGIKGFTAANLDAALNLRLSGDGAAKKAAVSMNVNRALSGKLVIEKEGKRLLELPFSAKPGDVVHAETDAGNAPLHLFTARVLSDGKEVLVHTPRKPEKVKPEDYADWLPEGFKSQAQLLYARRRGAEGKKAGKPSAEERYREAVRLFKWDQRNSCAKRLRELLKDEPEHVPSLVLLGMIRLWQMKYEEAEELLEKAHNLDRENTRAAFYLAAARRRRGNLEGARAAFSWVARRGVDLAHAARWQLAEIDIHNGKLEEALANLERAEQISSRADVPVILKAAVLRRLGRVEEALAVAQTVAARQATDCNAENEVRLALKALGRGGEAAESAARLEHKLRRTAQNYIVTALTYARAGLLPEALDVLDAYSPGKVEDNDGEALVHYYAAWLSHNAGKDDKQVAALLKKAAAAASDRAYADLPEAEAALLFAVERNKNDANARRLLGVLYGARFRTDEALKYLTQALRLQPGSDLVLRDLGYLYWTGLDRKRVALHYYRKAVKGGDYRIICETDRLVSEMGARAARKALWKNVPEPLLAAHNEVRTRYLHFLADTGKYAEGLKLLGKYTFYSAEGGFETRRMFDDCHLYMALEYHRRGEHEKALKEMDSAKEYPPNLLIDTTVREANSRMNLIEGDLLAAMGKKKEARAKYLEGTREKLEWASPAYYFKGLCQKRLGRNRAAIETAKELKGRLDRHELFWAYMDAVEEIFLRSLVALLQGEMAKARKLLGEVLKKRPCHRWANYLKTHGYEIF